MDYVSEEANNLAREFERRFQALRPEAGILFVGVKAHAYCDGDSTTYDVTLGVTREVGCGAGRALVRSIMRQEIAQGLLIHIDVFQGIPGAARGDSGDEKAGGVAP